MPFFRKIFGWRKILVFLVSRKTGKWTSINGSFAWARGYFNHYRTYLCFIISGLIWNWNPWESWAWYWRWYWRKLEVDLTLCELGIGFIGSERKLICLDKSKHWDLMKMKNETRWGYQMSYLIRNLWMKLREITHTIHI